MQLPLFCPANVVFSGGVFRCRGALHGVVFGGVAARSQGGCRTDKGVCGQGGRLARGSAGKGVGWHVGGLGWGVGLPWLTRWGVSAVQGMNWSSEDGPGGAGHHQGAGNMMQYRAMQQQGGGGLWPNGPQWSAEAS